MLHNYKTLSILGALALSSLMFAETASAQGSVSITRTSTDTFGNRTSFTRRHNSDGSDSVSLTRTGTDVFGNRKSVTRTTNDNGSVRCQTVTSRNSDAFGGSTSRTARRCAADF
jgi:hypothetical protein